MKEARKLLIPLLISYIWTIGLVIGVIINANFALTRAAGGQFDSIPIPIRFSYIFTLLIILFGIRIWWQKNQGKQVRPSWILAFYFYLNCLSTATQLISKSSNERWNAVPAAIIAYSFYLARKAA